MRAVTCTLAVCKGSAAVFSQDDGRVEGGKALREDSAPEEGSGVLGVLPG